jgi:hypothetical protein
LVKLSAIANASLDLFPNAIKLFLPFDTVCLLDTSGGGVFAPFLSISTIVAPEELLESVPLGIAVVTGVIIPFVLFFPMKKPDRAERRGNIYL